MKSFTCLWVANSQANFFQRVTPTIRRSSGGIVSSSICGSLKHNVGTEGIDKQITQKRMC